MHSLLNNRPRRCPISLTPLIDVVFILLIFLMLASKFTDFTTMSLRLPAAGADDRVTAPPVYIRLSGNGELSVNGSTSTLPGLGAAIPQQGNRAGQPQPRVLIVPDPGVPVQRVVDVLDRLITLGIHGAMLADDQRTTQ